MALRTALVSAQGEIAQLRQTVSGLRESLELAQIDKTNSVNRERSLFADDLFVRTPIGMEPTARAREIAPLVEARSNISRPRSTSAAAAGGCSGA